MRNLIISWDGAKIVGRYTGPGVHHVEWVSQVSINSPRTMNAVQGVPPVMQPMWRIAKNVTPEDMVDHPWFDLAMS